MQLLAKKSNVLYESYIMTLNYSVFYFHDSSTKANNSLHLPPLKTRVLLYQSAKLKDTSFKKRNIYCLDISIILDPLALRSLSISPD